MDNAFPPNRPRGEPYAVEKRGALLLLLAAITWAVLMLLRQAPRVAAPAPRIELPERVGEWVGMPLYFCQNETCSRGFAAWELPTPDRCPVCGAPLGDRSVAEQHGVFADVFLARRVYRNGWGETVAAVMVMSAAEQRSIHRPEQCLPAQGATIDRRRRIAVPLPGRKPLDVALIEAHQEADGGRDPLSLLYAYWFTDGRHETPSHWRRLMLWSWDMVLGRPVPRWRYIALTTHQVLPDRQESVLRELIAGLHPLIQER